LGGGERRIKKEKKKEPDRGALCASSKAWQGKIVKPGRIIPLKSGLSLILATRNKKRGGGQGE